MSHDGAAPVLLAYRALGLGDLLTAVPALRALARAWSAHRHVLAAPRVLEPLALMTGAVDEVVDTRAFEPLLPELLLHGISHVDVAVNLHGRGPQSHELLYELRARRVLAFAHAAVPGTAGFPRWEGHEHEVARWCRMLREHGIEADPADLAIEPPRLDLTEVFGAEVDDGTTVMHVGAASGSRRWPVTRFAAVARAELRRGRSVLFTGSASERHLASRAALLSGAPDSSVLAGRTGLTELAAVVGAAGRVVCGDTGVAHLATALQTPSVVLFGPTPPAEWGPPPDRPWHIAIWKGMSGDPHADAIDAALAAITVEEVLDAIDDLEARVGTAATAPPPASLTLGRAAALLAGAPHTVSPATHPLEGGREATWVHR